jgi:hypothetical protein
VRRSRKLLNTLSLRVHDAALCLSKILLNYVIPLQGAADAAITDSRRKPATAETANCYRIDRSA